MTIISENLTIFLELYFNGAGVKNTFEYSLLSNKFAYSDGGVFLLGKYYTNLGFNYQVSPLINLTMLFKTNILDKSNFLSLNGKIISLLEIKILLKDLIH